jgi:hypothetical protein
LKKTFLWTFWCITLEAVRDDVPVFGTKRTEIQPYTSGPLN